MLRKFPFGCLSERDGDQLECARFCSLPVEKKLAIENFIVDKIEWRCKFKRMFFGRTLSIINVCPVVVTALLFLFTFLTVLPFRNQSCQVRGWLCKRGVKGITGRKWRRRWFSTDRDGRLYYYQKNNNTLPRGWVSVDIWSVISHG